MTIPTTFELGTIFYYKGCLFIVYNVTPLENIADNLIQLGTLEEIHRSDGIHVKIVGDFLESELKLEVSKILDMWVLLYGV